MQLHGAARGVLRCGDISSWKFFGLLRLTTTGDAL